ncbi:MAG: PP2C family protein-serine/threonine phosphatase [Anaerolineae bacterium]|nr:PP2C family protein-serine/threonine phosphatase [Anaerolineae bacterium]
MENPLERELEIGRQIQASFLPEQIPQLPGWEIAARFQPVRQVGGDFYDVFPLVQNRRLGLVIGDVCGKGVGAALYMALFRTLIRAFAQQHQTLHWMDALSEEKPSRQIGGRRPVLPSIGTSALKNAIELTNNYMADVHGHTSMFATVFLGVLDPSSGMLLYVNGGHEHPLLVNSAGVKERLATTGPVVGLFAGTRFDIQSVCIEPGDILVAFTDGVTEACNAQGEFFEHERLYALMAQPVSTASELLDSIQASVREFMGEADPSDDIALLAIRRQ